MQFLQRLKLALSSSRCTHPLAKVTINEGFEGENPGHVKEIRNNSKEDIGQVGAGVDP